MTIVELRRRAIVVFARGRHRVRNAPIAINVLSAVTGSVVSVVVLTLEMLTRKVRQFVFDLPDHVLLTSGADVAWWRLLLIPPALGLLTGVAMFLMARRWPGETVDPIEANALFGGKMSLGSSVRLVLGTIGSNISGAAVGMEAAYSQIGAALFSSLGQTLRLRRSDLRLITAAGAAAAIAAAFNAPFAGAFYGFELVLGSYTIGMLGPIGVAVVSATLTLRALSGNELMFALPHIMSPDLTWEYVLFVVIGIEAALLGIVVMRLVTAIDRLVRRLRIPPWGRPAIGGLCVGLLALVTSTALGSGHGAVRSTLTTVSPMGALATLLVVKMLASAVSLGTGFRGGLFSTSLMMGSLLGMLVGRLSEAAMGLPAHQLQAFSVVGMGAMGTAIVGAPMTMTTLVIETSGDLPAAFGVLTGTVVASLLVRRLFGYSFATWRFHLRGMGIRGAHDIGWLSDLTAGRLMRRDYVAVARNLSLHDLRLRVPLGSASEVVVIDEEGRYVGMIDVALAHDRALDDADKVIIADELAGMSDWVLTRKDPVRVALARFDAAGVKTLAVVESVLDRRVAGTLSETYALRRYSQQLERKRGDDLGERGLFSGSGVADDHVTSIVNRPAVRSTASSASEPHSTR